MSRVPEWLGRLGAGLTELSKRLDERRTDADQESRESQGEQKTIRPRRVRRVEALIPCRHGRTRPCSCPQPGDNAGAGPVPGWWTPLSLAFNLAAVRVP
jgi:hypothetical protein